MKYGQKKQNGLQTHSTSLFQTEQNSNSDSKVVDESSRARYLLQKSKKASFADFAVSQG